MIAIRDIPKPIRDLYLVDSLDVQGTPDDAIIRRIAYSISPFGDEFKVTFHKAELLKAEAEQLVKDYFIARKQARS